MQKIEWLRKAVSGYFRIKESNYETNIVAHRLEDIESKAPSKEVRNVADEIDRDRYT